MPGDEWKKLSDQVKEPYRKGYEAAKAQYDRDANGGTNEKKKGCTGTLRKETLQLRASKKASKDKECSQETRWWSLRSAPGRKAGGDQEKSVGGPQDHRRDQESW